MSMTHGGFRLSEHYGQRNAVDIFRLALVEVKTLYNLSVSCI